MAPCHTKPFVQPGVVISRHDPAEPPPAAPQPEGCDYCGSLRLVWRKCKLICAECQQINKSCADL
jgi:hypothetical protein